ncbi:protein FAR1-RELATED SEQUENCE 2 [Lathyrus oleraceus]|uniref:protein FAR1-RELATED SEQUENCE 2 n=1 Tax=Pisum sativum TaxID=3888 RepID=UPI0021D1FE60|nr:protein FAR1-RELATED SEQUENCE 2-like [Pisum sativum]
MSTTQSSESIHAFFDGYINSTTSLNQFMKQYDNALRSRAEKEFEADFNSMDTTILCGSNSSIEKQFQSEFTNAKFKEIQVEFRSKRNCSASLNSMEDCFATYHVLEEILVGDIRKERVLKVVLNKENHDFKCECSLFEFRGIVCRHVLSVCSQERIECNIGMVENQFGSNICVESSLEVVNREHYLDSSIVIGNCMSFMDLLTTCETTLTGSSQVIQVEYSGGMLKDCKLNFVLIQIVNGASQTWLIHCTKLVNGSLTSVSAVPHFKTRKIAVPNLVNTLHEVVNAVPDFKTMEIAVPDFKTMEIAVPDLVNTFHEVG